MNILLSYTNRHPCVSICSTITGRIVGASVVLLGIILITPRICAEEAGPPLVESSYVRGFKVLIMDDKLSANTTADQRLYFGVITTNIPTSIWVPEQSEYEYQVELLDSRGDPVPKTKAGSAAGANFFKLDASSLNNGVKLTQPAAQKRGDGLATFYLFKTKDLFIIEKDGDYTLRLRLQFMVHVGNATNNTFQIIRFPTLDCHIKSKQSQK